MNLDKEQLAAIKAFISKKGIKYLDVQMEILDHVASGVEEKISANPNLSFEAALKQTHASFGIFGFGGVEDAIVNGIGKKYNKIFWKNFLSFFGYKYILVVFFGGILAYQLQTLVKDYEKFLIIFLFITVVLVGIEVLILIKNSVYKNFLIYRISGSYLGHIGSFFILFNFVVSKTSNAIVFGINRNFALGSIVLVVSIIYIISALKTSIIGVKESKLLMEKYKPLT